MDYGKLLTRALNIIWEHKFLILLGALIALGSGGNGGASSRLDLNFDRPGRAFETPQPPNFEELPEFPGIPDPERFFRSIPTNLSLVAIFAIAALVIFIGIPLWVLSTISRGALIAGVNTIEGGGTSSFGQAFNAGWRKGWTLVGIGLLPAIPGLVIAAVGAIGVLGYLGVARIDTGRALLPFGGAALGLLAVLACLLVPVALVLSLLQTFANQACMLEDAGVFAAYRRGFSVLLEHIGSALLLFLIQIVVSFALGLMTLLPNILLLLCCFLWPVLLLIQGAITAYFSTLWTLAWRQWAGLVDGAAASAIY